MNKKPKKTNKQKSRPEKKTKSLVVSKKVVLIENTEKKDISHDYLELPINEIKKDLVGMLIFAILALVSILILKQSAFDYTSLVKLFSR